MCLILCFVLKETHSYQGVESSFQNQHHEIPWENLKYTINKEQFETRDFGGLFSHHKRNENNPKQSEMNTEPEASKSREEYCASVCNFCRTILSIRWAALCFGQCVINRGKSHDACAKLYADAYASGA